ncbi:MAG: alpha/beta hydrolase, partial [Lentisphaeria bacterium]|nr:alpha/beta hydrolase [Lentisphaeria bacterium]
MNSYKTVVIHDFDIAYREQGSGEVFLFVHGFGGSSLVWEQTIEQMPQNSRCIAIDLKGFGESFKAIDDQLSLFNQAEIISGFVEQLDLNDFTLVAHSSGAVSSLIALFDPNFQAKVKKLFMISSDGYLGVLPEFVNQARQLINDHFFYPKVINKTLVRSLLIKSFHNPEKISDAVINSYLFALQKPDTKKSILASARQIEIGNLDFFIAQLKKIKIPIQIVIGKYDNIIDYSSLNALHEALSGSQVHTLADCGHLPHQEEPIKLVDLILNPQCVLIKQPSVKPIPSRKGRLR